MKSFTKDAPLREAPRTELRLLPLRLVLKSETLTLDFFSGPLWRSGFGLALKKHFPVVFDLLFADQASLGRLYSLRPPTRSVRTGECFELGLNLFGAATDHAIACAQALARLGEMGLGERRGTYKLINAYVEGADVPFFDASSGLVAWPGALSSARWLEKSTKDVNVARVDLLTPLRIKDNNATCFGPPEFSQIVRRILGRLAQLCEAADEASPLSQELAKSQIRLADNVSLQHCSEFRREQVTRRSSRSQQTMDFAGITGSLFFRGDLAPFAGLLALGEITQLGGKTAFGFGRIHTRFSFED
ncbi:CRISPR system precrRNA processing endoribonuclease RAMP protein Cas6 [Propionivibrio sp.]|uniref:CRISPR system precrRNA processing endoribonuclease RAMP protein Cas6 n=1 Tax=Propionivibrio sp. TaxID=2212460 RepID=UPI003BEF85F5